MSIFTELYDLHAFESIHAYQEFLRKLARALEEGWVEEIPVVTMCDVPRNERWFREKYSGEVYSLEELEGKPSSWRPVEPERPLSLKQFSLGSDLKN